MFGHRQVFEISPFLDPFGSAAFGTEAQPPLKRLHFLKTKQSSISVAFGKLKQITMTLERITFAFVCACVCPLNLFGLP